MTADTEKIYEASPPPDIPFDPAALPSNLQLTDVQQKLFDDVLKYFDKEDYVLPDVENGTLTEEEKFWLSAECLLRFLRAVKWASAQAAIKRLEGTLKWRREFGVYDVITASHVEPEALTGKMVLWGYDTDNRPALYLRPSRQNTEESIRQVHFVVWALERLTELMGPGVETLALMVNFADRAKNPSLTQSRLVLNILQTHYPERLGRALVANVPFLVNAFFKFITPFIDPLTRPKLRFNPDCTGEGLFAPGQLLAEWEGGQADFEYVHERYWEPLVRLCAERREKMWVAWRELGAKVGVREWDVKCKAELEAKAKEGEEGTKATVGTPITDVAAEENEAETQNGEAAAAVAL
ncbi:CRAL/TRIO domain-containing protein [Dichomitus squalens]|uniref:CRAL/TRIO domain-containing protein n=1 Tax=Dichomitus squalens TaxID=114155 RepID=A0A4Q9QEJ6_9APHY|nr:CRAL/TRIO domain-containing protein [Dichomitus squalens]TBU44304.1 CRAL/TRIO domain-containing protein [Dichomitus squalens]TBU65224.1 CRAL/TRIO domain-containing protein [Dichomitus squalens]